MVNDKSTIPEMNDLGSSLSGYETKRVLEKQARDNALQVQEMQASGVNFDLASIPADQLQAARERMIKMAKSSPGYQRMIELYDVDMQGKTIAGVYTEVFTPKHIVENKDSERVLINVHGGSFVGGERSGSHLESIPISAITGIKVISIDYRLAPEYQFPAASDDVLAVYKELLKQYEPKNIGIYGSSAGAVLTAQSLARFQVESLPSPAAAGMLAAGAYYWMEGDSGYSGHIGRAISGVPEGEYDIASDLYFKDVDKDNCLAFPGRNEEMISNFPPSLLISSTRDFALSSVVHTHTQLTANNVEADLHVWEGLDHCFYFDPSFPESTQVYNVVAKFFNKHLG